MDFDNIADNEDQLYRDLLEEEQKNKKDSPSYPKSNNNYDDESEDNYR